jgi:hypothetical protein
LRYRNYEADEKGGRGTQRNYVHNEELRNLISLPSTIRIIYSRRISGACSTHRREGDMNTELENLKERENIEDAVERLIIV